MLTLEGAGGLAAAGVGEEATGALLVTCAPHHVCISSNQLSILLTVRYVRSCCPPEGSSHDLHTRHACMQATTSCILHVRQAVNAALLRGRVLSGKALATCIGGGGDSDTRAGGGLPMTDMPTGGGVPSKPPPLTPPLTPGGVGCVGMLPVAYTSHWALSRKDPACCFGGTMGFVRTVERGCAE